MTGPRHTPPSRRGIALLVTLVVILLITMFLSNFSFSTALELRMLQTERERLQARTLARAAFTALESSLLQDESDFLAGYRQIQDVLKLSAIPWEEGLLYTLEVEPLDPLFNLNRFYNMQPGAPQSKAAIALFQNVMADVQVQPAESSPALEPLPAAEASALYAAIFDWIDKDNLVSVGIPGAYGAEQADYFSDLPAVRVKNMPLDRLTEIRGVKRVANSHVPWRDWETRFTIYEPKAAKANLYPGLINVNWATHDQIVAFLKARSFPNPDTLDQESRAAQIEFNIYADKAEAIANALIGESDALGLPFAVRKLKDKDIAGKLKEAGVGAKSQYLKQVFSVSDEYFRVRIVVGVGESRAQIDAAVHTVRKPERTSEGAEVLEYTLN